MRLLVLTFMLTAAFMPAGCSKDGGRLNTRPEDIPDGFLGIEPPSVPLFEVITPLELPLDIRHTLERDGWDESFPVAYSISAANEIIELPQTLFSSIDNLPRNIRVVWAGWLDQASPTVARTVRRMLVIENTGESGNPSQDQ